MCASHVRSPPTWSLCQRWRRISPPAARAAGLVGEEHQQAHLRRGEVRRPAVHLDPEVLEVDPHAPGADLRPGDAEGAAPAPQDLAVGQQPQPLQREGADAGQHADERDLVGGEAGAPGAADDHDPERALARRAAARWPPTRRPDATPGPSSPDGWNLARPDRATSAMALGPSTGIGVDRRGRSPRGRMRRWRSSSSRTAKSSSSAPRPCITAALATAGSRSTARTCVSSAVAWRSASNASGALSSTSPRSPIETATPFPHCEDRKTTFAQTSSETTAAFALRRRNAQNALVSASG